MLLRRYHEKPEEKQVEKPAPSSKKEKPEKTDKKEKTKQFGNMSRRKTKKN